MKVAILGYGFMGGVHLAAMQRIAGVEVRTVAARTRPASDVAVKGNLDLESGPLPETVRWVSNWREAVTDPEIDAVDVCLPTDMHREVVLASLSAGKHVLCEKPMALNAADCDRMMAAAEDSRRVFMVGQVLRFMYPYLMAAEFVQSKGTDAVRRATLQRSTGFPGWGGWLGDEARSGGAILDLLSHDLDQALHLFGAPQTVSSRSVGPVDTMRGALHYANGLRVQVQGGWTEPDTPFAASFEIHADDSAVTLQDGVLKRVSGSLEEILSVPDHDPYHDQIAYFIDCCQRGVSPERCPPAASADAVRISLLLKQSRDANGREMEWNAR